MRLKILQTLLLSSATCFSQVAKDSQISAIELLDRSMEFHDPLNEWTYFNHTFNVTMSSPNKADRFSEIIINIPEEYFSLVSRRGDDTTWYELIKNKCVTEESMASDIAKKHCERAVFMCNYYTYLYGLPMKLKDLGTIIQEPVEQIIFKEKEYLRIKVSYVSTVGSDVWFFYFNPVT